MNCQPEREQTRASAVLAAGTLVSRLLGLGRDLLLAFLLGPAADAFLVAFRLPNVFRRLLAEGSLGMAYGAAVTRLTAEHGPAAGAGFVRSVSLRLFLFALPATALLALFAGPITYALAPGLPPETRAHSVHLLRLCLLYLPLCLISAVACAHAASSGEYRPQAWASALFNVLVILSGTAACLLFSGAGRTVDTNTAEYALCAGVVCGGVAQACLGLRLAAPHGWKAAFPEDKDCNLWALIWRAVSVVPAGTGRLLRSLPASALGAAPHQLQILAGAILASLLFPGGISALYFAERLVELPLGLFGAAVGLAALPRLAALAAGRDFETFSRNLGSSISFGAFLSLPAGAGLFVLARPLADLLFGHGAYDDVFVDAIAAVVRGYALGLPALCASRPLLAAVNALERGPSAVRGALLSLAPLTAVSLAGMLLFGRQSHEAALCLGLGLCAGAWSNAWLLFRCLKDAGIASPLSHTRSSLISYAAAALLMGATLLVLDSQTGSLGVVSLSVLVCVCVLLWCGGFLALKSRDARTLLDMVREFWAGTEKSSRKP